MRRFALPLALSLAAHALLLALLWLLPTTVAPSSPDGPTRGLAVTLCIRGPERSPSVKASKTQEWDINVEPPRIVPAGRPDSPPGVVPMAMTIPPLASTGAPGGGGGVGAAGPPAPAGPIGSSLLPVPRRTQKIVYLLDRSVSMGQHDAFDRARAELTLSLRALPAGTLFQVFAYNRGVTPLIPAPAGLALADPSHIHLAVGALDDLTPTGSTDHVGALRRGLALRPEVLFWLTDADDLSDADVNTITRANTGGTTIHIVELTRHLDERPDGPLTRLAVVNGGSHRRVRPGR